MKNATKCADWEFDRAQLRPISTLLRDSFIRKSPPIVHLRPRFKIVIDPFDDYFGTHHFLLELEHWGKERTGAGECAPQVRQMFLSNYPADATPLEDARVVGTVRHFMETGVHVLLFNPYRVLGHLFDVLNQNYSAHTVVVTQSDGTAQYVEKYFANVAIGAESHECPVHDDFAITFVIRQQEIHRIAATSTQKDIQGDELGGSPFLSRHEQYLFQLPPPSTRVCGHCWACHTVCKDCRNTIFCCLSAVHNRVAREMVHRESCAVPLTPLGPRDLDSQRQLVFKCNAALLQIASPEAVLLSRDLLVREELYV